MTGTSDNARKAFLQRVTETAGANVVLTAVAGAAGLFLAARLGAAGRGQYAAIQSWFGILTIVGELGLTASTCFHIARDPDRAADWLATSRTVLFALGACTGLTGLALSPVLSDATLVPLLGFACVFAIMPIVFVAGAWTFAMQASDTRRWNYARLTNPLVYGMGILGLGALGRLTLLSATAVLVVAVCCQAIVAQRLSHAMAAGGRAQRSMVSPLLRFGVSSFAGSVPYAFNARIDQVLLTLLVGSAELGNYAVAVSLTLLASPLSAAFGSVIMPSLASGATDDDSRLVRAALRGALIVGVAVVTPIAVGAPLLATRVLGPSFGDVPVLVALLAPGAVVLGCNQVLGDILRGKGRPLDVGRCEGAGLLTTAVLLAVLVPPLGAQGAAIASTAAYSVSFVLLLRRVAAGG